MRKYVFSEHGVGYKVGKTLQPYRPQNEVIFSWITPYARVLDVGCGDGVLGEKLIAEKHCRVFGLDIDRVGVKEANRRGIKGKVYDVDEGLPYPSQSFDVVIVSDVLQCVFKPDMVVSESLRVGKRVIVEFPNFGFWFYRLEMLLGRFPKLSLYGHTWWNTLHTRFFSLKDFLSLPSLKKARIKTIVCIDWKNREVSILAKLNPNLFGRSCILELESR